MYKAIEYFTDLQDSGYAYKIGDVYPREGYTPSDERIAELAGDGNVRGRAVIEAIVAEEPTEVVAEEEKPKKRSRKKADD